MNAFIKRLIDIIAGVLSVIVFSLVMIIVAVAIKIDSKGPILFKQVRVGKNDSRFTIYKFRSMSVETPKDAPTHLLEDVDSHITSVGKFIRKTSLDELPQLFNILKGDMTLIGPRPSLPIQEDLNQLRRENGSIALKPGLTGLAQIKGRDELPIPIKAAFDAEYMEKMSTKYDFQIFLATFIAVFKSHGVKEGTSFDNSENI